MIFGVMSLAMPFPKESQWVYLKVNVFFVLYQDSELFIEDMYFD